MKFKTSLPVEASDLQINYRSRMVLLGSCFSENIGQALTHRKFTALINPLGISYNPISILKNVTTIVGDGLVVDRRSKSLLIAALAHMINDKDVFYFPSYELLVDDLRDYRFYKEDLIHPTDQAIRYIWEYFSKTFLSEETKSQVLKVEKINDMLEHKITNPGSEDAQIFQEKIKKEIESISDIIPIEKWDH